MLASRLARCSRFSSSPSSSSRAIPKPPHPVARQAKVRKYSNTPFDRPRYVRFGASGPEEPGQEKGSPWDVRNWDRNTKVAAGIGAFVVGYYVTHLERVPETGRWRFMDISPKYESQLAEASHQELLQEFKGKVLPPNHPITRHVRRVTQRILEANDLGTLDAPDVHRPKGADDVWSFDQQDQLPPEVGGPKQWHLFVVADDKVVNAMAAYGNIVVFTGILPVAKDEDGLAAVLGHEIGHAVARHASERYSSLKVFILLALILDMVGIPFASATTRLLYDLPNSRTMEYEADKIGIRLSSRACFDPNAVPEMFSRLGKLEQAMGSRHIDFLTTHPASEKRSAILREMLPEAYAVQAASPTCGATADHMAAFRDSWLGDLNPDRMSETRWS
ncbi:peptidase family M48-domain-containing protein [Dichomitus squalens]|uniref:Peptidase family M48-domain-containing protein n=1 Tax=Dichomitus squalens TaxID=114155 RepID=A0A4Q9MKD3_9APHY|nr:peptidase family M48-domain-containing protein [Dichomitus squalens]